MEKLTKRQSQVLEFIRETIADSGMPPTVAEIAAAMGVSSTNGIRGHLQALERKDAIELVPNASRGIRLLDQTEAEAGNREQGLDHHRPAEQGTEVDTNDRGQAQ